MGLNLNELKAELENCRGGGRIGRLKARMVEAQIRAIETLEPLAQKLVNKVDAEVVRQSGRFSSLDLDDLKKVILETLVARRVELEKERDGEGRNLPGSFLPANNQQADAIEELCRRLDRVRKEVVEIRALRDAQLLINNQDLERRRVAEADRDRLLDAIRGLFKARTTELSYVEYQKVMEVVEEVEARKENPLHVIEVKS